MTREIQRVVDEAGPDPAQICSLASGPAAEVFDIFERKVILGNFHPRNTSRALMEYILDWKLIHRDEDDMNRLMKASKFGRPFTEIVFEEAGVNMFASCIKP
ncbi:MAG: hypothetical protein CL389_01350 [Acidiferrobacteraceae bacterium]|nr:hypothetical protein [Acidiferrobacteraceae bacterium]